jgi:hypothetical protein
VVTPGWVTSLTRVTTGIASRTLSRSLPIPTSSSRMLTLYSVVVFEVPSRLRVATYQLPPIRSSHLPSLNERAFTLKGLKVKTLSTDKCAEVLPLLYTIVLNTETIVATAGAGLPHSEGDVVRVLRLA